MVLRYPVEITQTIAEFTAQVRAILPPIVAYRESDLHSTIGTYGKRDLAGFAAEDGRLMRLSAAVEKALARLPPNPVVELGGWLYNAEAVLISGYPNQDLWRLFKAIEAACRENDVALEMGRIIHVTTARFIHKVTHSVFEQFVRLMQTAPRLGSTRLAAVELAIWRCDGLTFALLPRVRFEL